MAAPLPDASTCILAGHASLRIAAEDIAAHRRAPGPACGPPIPFSLLKNADEQTVAGVGACLRAIAGHGLAPDGTPEPFRQWGIIGAARYFSRDFMCRVVADFVAEGPLAVAPHTIPHRTLHSPSGTLSLALGIQGPNHGAGGGPGCEIEGLLCALALLHEQKLPGVWLLLSRVAPIIDGDPLRGQIPPGTFSEAVALALVPDDSPLPGSALTLVVDDLAEGPAFTLDSVQALLSGGGSCVVPGFGRLELKPARGVLRSAA